MVKRTLMSGGYEAEFFADNNSAPPVIHYIITLKSSADILAWGQEKSAKDAEKAALDCMHDLYERALGRAAAG